MERETLQAYCRRMNMEYLLDEWDAEKNLPDTPDTVAASALRKMWWRCREDHSWQTQIYLRTRRESACPFCAGKRVVAGQNDLLSTMPELCEDWDVEKNAPLTPEQISHGSNRLIWWRCASGHSWRASVNSRSQGSDCPICTNRKLLTGYNDLRTCYPKLADEWDTEKNGCGPEYIVATSSKRAWWRCGLGHCWEVSALSRVYHNSGCPYCSGRKVLAGFNDLASQKPELAARWDYEKNGSLRPEQVTAASHKKVWWHCQFGHFYDAPVYSQSQGSGCPYCAGRRVLPGFNDLKTKFPKVAAQWHPTLNAPLTPEQVMSSSNQYVWWICEEGHVWKAVIHSRTRKTPCGCPICAGKYPKQYRRN